MRTRTRYAVLYGGLLLAIIGLVVVRGFSQRTGAALLRQWMRDERGTTAMQLSSRGSNAVPHLLAALNAKETQLQRFWRNVYPRIPFTIRTHLHLELPPSAKQVAEHAVSALIQLGPEGQMALPELLRQLEAQPDARSQEALREAIWQVGSDSGPANDLLLVELNQPDEKRRRAALSAIYRLRRRLPGCVPIILHQIRNSDSPPTEHLLALSVQGVSATHAVPRISSFLYSPPLRRNTLTALAGIGTNLRSTIPGLLHVLESTNLNLHCGAIEVLALAGTDARPALVALTNAINHPNPVVYDWAAYALAQVHQTPSHAVPDLLDALNHPAHNPRWEPWPLDLRQKGQLALRPVALDHRQTAAWLLGDLGPPAHAALPALTECLRERDPLLPSIAARGIYLITGQPNLEPLLQALRHPNEDACLMALIALHELGPRARAARDAVEQIRTRSLSLRRASWEVLRRIDSDEPSASRIGNP